MTYLEKNNKLFEIKNELTGRSSLCDFKLGEEFSLAKLFCEECVAKGEELN